MYAWESIKEVLDYIEEHLDEELDVQILADQAHLSIFYFQRLFYRLVKKTVKEYVNLRRMEKASILLREESTMTILDIALACGYQSHSSFTKAFKEVYGLTPQTYRIGNMHLDHFIKPDVSLMYTMVDERVPLICEDMVLEIHTEHMLCDELYVGKEASACSAMIGQPKVNPLIDLWDALEKERSTMESYSKLGIGIDVLTPGNTQEEFQYFAGFAAEKEIPGYVSWYMPKGTYVVCTYEAESFDTLVKESLYKASRYLYEVWLQRKQLLPDPLIVQKYHHPKGEACSIELWAKVQA